MSTSKLVPQNAAPLSKSPWSPADICRRIDHTLLKPDASYTQIEKHCHEALKFSFATVCVNGIHLPLVVNYLKGSEVLPIVVVGFPLGASTQTTKAFETQDAIKAGACEIDMVINISALKSGDDDTVRLDIKAVVEAAEGRTVKVILETSLLTTQEKKRACLLAKEAGAQFVKTSTGFAGGGATVDDILLMKAVVGAEMKVKASGGIRSLEDAILMLDAGADRLGTSSSVAIVTGGLSQESY